MRPLNVAVAGNPNSGKTTLFNTLTGAQHTTGNWPGVTVEGAWGNIQWHDTSIQIVDLPGVYALDAGETSADVRVARDFLVSGEADLIVNVVDASALERHLYLSTQLLEMNIPMVVAVNKIDRAEREGIEIDYQRLSAMLGCPVIPICARRGTGVDKLKDLLADPRTLDNDTQADFLYPSAVESVLEHIHAQLQENGNRIPNAHTWLTAALLAGERPEGLHISAELEGYLHRQRHQLEESFAEDIDIIIADAHYSLAHKLAGRGMRHTGKVTRSLSDRIDSVVLHPLLGLPIFFAAMYLLFTLTINVGGAFIDFFDLFTGALLVDGLGSLMQTLGSPTWLRVILADGIGGGIQTVATFIPIIAFLYLFLSLLEDSGYMARVALIMDRLMSRLGLPGKAFVPLVVGFGCNVPAIMATRTLDSPRERLLTIMMTPFMSCGARLSVYALFAAAFFPENGGLVVMLLYLIGMAVAILTAFMLRHTLLQGEAEPFMLELPAYSRPSLRNVLMRTWHRIKGFATDAGRLIIAMVLVLNVLSAIGTDGSFGEVEPNQSVLAASAQGLTGAFAPMGLEEDNWPAVVGIISGLLAKEVVVGTLDAVYSAQAGAEADAAGEGSWLEGVGEAFASIPANLAGVVDLLLDPLGLGILPDNGDLALAAAEQDVDPALFGNLVSAFDGQVGAFAYLLFVLLYFPCVSATAAIRRESSMGWTVFAVLWSTGLAYVVATAFYQAATFARHPTSSSLWLGGLVMMLVLFVAILHRFAGRRLV